MKPGIDASSVEKMLNEFIKSPEGKKEIKKYLDHCVENDIRETDGGSAVVTKEMMEEAARLMIQILKNTAFSTGELPESVRAHFSSLDYDPPTKVSGAYGDKYMINISFTDDLSRFSLRIASGSRKGQFTGDGIKNIVSLFDTGYAAKNYAYGLWYGHEDAGIIRSKQTRAGLHFMQDAVDHFNSTYSKKYGVEAYIAADPEFYARSSGEGNFNEEEE